MLLLLALLYNDVLQFQFSTMRYAGVLQRLAICYGVCSLLYLFVPLRGRILAAVAILLGYWAMMVWIPVPGGVAGDLSPAGNLSGYIDRTYLPGRILKDYYGFGDNEGILSTIPAIVTGLLGVFAGEWLRSQRGPAEKCFGMAAAGVVLLVVGTIWGQFFPVIKNLWTSSFVLVAGGYSLLLLSLFYAVLDWMQWRWWAWFWVVIGSNAILIYMIREVIDFTKISKYFLGGIASWSGPWQGVVIQAGSLAAMWLLLYWLYRRKIFLRA
jgi:predicted acyltransferase